MLKRLKMIFGILTLALAGFGLITKNFDYASFMILFLGAFMCVNGITALKKDKKAFSGYMNIFASLIALLVFIQSLFTS